MSNSQRDVVQDVDVPRQPIKKLVDPISRFMHVQAAGGVVLLLATVAALILANSTAAETYLSFWQTELLIEIGAFHFQHSLQHLVNDGLMVLFFFVVGLEVKRELVHGELNEPKRAALPVAAAVGGMIVPATIYLVVVAGGDGVRGWGIPMATDIAFVVGCMALLGSRAPHGLRILLLSLAIVDDIGAIIVIAVGYTEDLALAWLLGGLAGIGVILAFQRLQIRSFVPYILVGLFMWYAFHESGVHPTIAGVILGMLTPANKFVSEGSFANVLDRVINVILGGEWEDVPDRAEQIRQLQWVSRETISPLEYLERTLHPWTSFVIMPVFALANAGVSIQLSQLGTTVGMAVMLGLVVGKPLGVVGASWLLIRSGLGKLPRDINWPILIGGGCLAGIGFTMSIFIAGLALDEELLPVAKIGVLAASTVSGLVGLTVLYFILPSQSRGSQGEQPNNTNAAS